MRPEEDSGHRSACPDARSPPRTLVRRAWQGLALTCIGLGGIGAALPLIPTTPFLLLAAWAASRSSPELHQWLYQHPRYGPLLRDWRDHRALRPRVKYLALLLMAASWLVMLATIDSGSVRLLASIIMLPALVFVATRPARPRER